MVLNTKKPIQLLVLFFIFTLQSFSKWVVRKLTGLANQHKVSIIRDSGVLLMSTVKPMLMQFSGHAQCEDDFKRVEMNYIEKLGRLSEIKGQSVLYNDLEIRLIDVDEAKADYKKAAPWLKKLLNSYADGINFYLYKHPEVKPALTHLSLGFLCFGQTEHWSYKYC
jgi:acyl-homoserine lactone acylase PvdQ